MEPNPRSITEEVAADIRRSINALPPAHQVEPQDGELVDNIGLLYKDLRWQKRVVDLTDGFCTIFIIMITLWIRPWHIRVHLVERHSQELFLR